MHAYWQLRTSSQKLYQFYFSLLIACEFYNLICHRRVWQLEMHLFLIFAPGTVIFWVCVIINSLKKHRPQCYTYISALCTDKQKMCDPILVNLLKMQAHYSQSSRGNATPSSSTSPLASYMMYLPRGSFRIFFNIFVMTIILNCFFIIISDVWTFRKARGVLVTHLYDQCTGSQGRTLS